MRLAAFFAFILLLTLASCDVRSGIATKEMERFETKPTPVFSPLPTPTPVDPADIIAVDTAQEGETIGINSYEQTKTAACKKFDRVRVNGDDNTVTIKGVCRQIMVNGDRNKVTSDAAVEFVLNGSENTINYLYFANGKQPLVIEARTGNVIEKISAKAAATKLQSDRKSK